MKSKPQLQANGIYRRRIGNSVVAVINDGYEDFSFDILSSSITEEEAKELLVAADLQPIPRMNVNCYVVQDGKRTILIDAGDANCLGSGGKLQEGLAAAGIDPSEIDIILLTHAHPDHVGGLTFRGAPLFAQAELILHEDELRFWQEDSNFSGASNQLHAMRRLALDTFEAYRHSIRTSQEGEVAPGITMLPLFGHTPGHSGFLLSSDNQSVLIWGDIVHWPDIQIPRPEVSLAFDVCQQQAAATRQGLLDMVASDNILVGGMHLNFPGFIRIQREKDTYSIPKERGIPTL